MVSLITVETIYGESIAMRLSEGCEIVKECIERSYIQIAVNADPPFKG